ncbi:hypothetical protein D9758_000956 [Tetrapyrgos nigripes]|uniref:Uncharacterized protein n=1 Tax=Tetrapyrgos nigripes TaxID=182062 RepID=A0A8H5GZB6_9AGAR|nr:hypothetical protein D9758_000956 [Tetrapyrgos nigripes]
MLPRPSTPLATVAAASVNALAVPVVAPDVFVPRIITPNQDTVWVKGATVEVTWDTSDAPAVISKGSAVGLNKADIPIDRYSKPGNFLAEDFDLRAGSVSIVVPSDIDAGDDHSITLFSDSSNRGEQFSIIDS